MRSMVGAVALVSLGVGGLFLALPRLTAYVLSGASFALAAVAAWLFVRRRWPSQ